MNTLTYYEKLDKLTGKRCMSDFEDSCSGCVLSGKHVCHRIIQELGRMKFRSIKRKLDVQ